MLFLYCLAFGCILCLLVETKRPISKQQQDVWHIECELGVISDPDCPIDGGWSPWSPWSACKGPCDELGSRRRSRKCDNPFPSQNGLLCTGPEHQIETCFITNCTVEDFRTLVKNNAVRKAALHELEAIPTLMERCLQKECPFKFIVATLARDNTWQINPESLWIKLQCVKYNLGCPVMGEWGPWSEWTQCGARCGYGLRWKLRRCDSPPPSSAHLICAGSPLHVEECTGDQCASVKKRDSKGRWGQWEEWSPCSENCGLGIKRRKRTCYETKTPRLLFSSWGTHCRGQYDQIEVCENTECKLNGGWSGWGPWGPCTQTCNVGRRSRIRTCTRPEPFGSGEYCSGPISEIGYCFLAPCIAFTHTVAVFKGESYLKYSFNHKRSTLFHFYARFLPLSPHGVLLRRAAQTALVLLRLQKWHICLDATGMSQTCTAPRLCTRTGLDPAVWHSVMITVTSEGTTLRVDDEPETIKSTFSCDPELPNLYMSITVGERLHGEIQELVLNFIPLSIVVNSRRDSKLALSPKEGLDITYEQAGIDEAYLILDYDQYLRLPCFIDQENWSINLTLKLKTQSGTIIFLQGGVDAWIHLYLQNARLKLKMAFSDLRAESLSALNYPLNQWLDITISKTRSINTIVTSINAGEDRLHVLFDNYFPNDHRTPGNFGIKPTPCNFPHEFCSDEYFVGGVPEPIRSNVASEDFNSLSAVIGSISVNNVLLDLHKCNVESYRDKTIQVSSRSASVSGSYFETSWGMSHHLNMTCLHSRYTRSPNGAYWLYLDTVVDGPLRGTPLTLLEDGRVLRLMASVDIHLRGYYTCRSHTLRKTRNIVTYGVLGESNHVLAGPDLTTFIAVFTTLALVIGTLVCLIIEGCSDIRDGYGFFRDAHLPPNEEAEAVCKFIDQNMHLMASKSAANISKARARLIGRHQANQSVISEHVESFIHEDAVASNDDEWNEPADLPALPEINISGIEPMHQAFKCYPCYVSSPRHGTISSPHTKLSSSSDAASPRVLCSRLLLGKRLNLMKHRLMKSKTSRAPRKARPKLFTIKSATYTKESPALMVLNKFRMLKSEDS